MKCRMLTDEYTTHMGWNDNKRNGWGEMTYTNGGVYEGNWKNGKRHGKGKYTYAGGVVYEGNWENNMVHGKGKLVTYSGREVYKGKGF